MSLVQAALSAVFRMTRADCGPLFPTLTSSNKLTMHFRFVAHSFVSNILGYIFDTAIGGNFDPFLSLLSPSSIDLGNSRISDVFALSKAHSSLLDDILSACLLRSGQRAVGELLRSSLELVLEFAILAGQRSRGVLQEYEAAPLLEEQFAAFCTKMTTLVGCDVDLCSSYQP